MSQKVNTEETPVVQDMKRFYRKRLSWSIIAFGISLIASPYMSIFLTVPVAMASSIYSAYCSYKLVGLKASWAWITLIIFGFIAFAMVYNFFVGLLRGLSL